MPDQRQGGLGERGNMTGLRSASGSMLLMIAALAFGQVGSPSSLGASLDEASTCSLGSLPSDIRNRLKSDFSAWKIQEPENLSEYARKTWADGKPRTCPGIAVGLFQSASTPSYAFMLVPADHPEAGYRFLVFTRKARKHSYEAAVVEKSDEHGASNYFIRKVPVSRFFNKKSKKRLQVRATDAILMVDSAEKEYEADIYFWSKGSYRQEPVDY